MTDPIGKVFISYKHEQKELAALLDASLREHGIPLWRDVSDLRSEPLQQELREVIADPGIAGGIAIVSEGVAGSDAILEVELPALHKRWRNEEAFFVVIALAPGIDHGDAEAILAEASSLHDFSSWFMEKFESDVDAPQAAEDIVDAVLERRTSSIHEYLPPDQPIACSLDTYEPPSHDPQPAVAIDWSSHFEDGLLVQSTWNDRLLPALRKTTDALSRHAIGRELRFYGRAHLSATFALGYCLQRPRGTRATWMQADKVDGHGHTPWTLTVDEKDSGLRGSLEEHSVTGSDLAVLLSVTDDVKPQVGRTKSTLPEFNGILELSPEEGPGIDLDPAQAAHAANVFREAVRSALDRVSKTVTIHLFMAVPAGLAFLCGQQTNTFPAIQTYVLNTGEGHRLYQPAVRLE